MYTDRRQAKRLIMRVPMRVRSLAEPPQQAQGAQSLNISLHGAYIPVQGEFSVGEKVEVWLKMPEVVVSGQKTEWCFTGRVAHVDRLGSNGKTGLGVHFLYYSAEKKNLQTI